MERPHAIQILTIAEDGSIELNAEALLRLLLDPSIADKIIAIISVAGAFRTGKSFILNFLRRYLNSNVSDQTILVLYHNHCQD